MVQKRTAISIYIIAAMVFIACLTVALTGKTVQVELKAFFGLSTVLGHRTGAILLFFTRMGNAAAVIALLAVLLAVPNRFFRNRIAFPTACATLCSWVLNETIKQVVQRLRPAVDALILAKGYSFPSGHAMNNTTLYLSLFLLVLRYMHPGKRRTALLCVLCAIPLIIGFSRIYVGVHYLSDVLAGAALGTVIALAMCQITQKQAMQP